MSYNNLSGFDAWLTRNPMEDLPEPSSRHMADARDQLSDEGGEMPSDDEVYTLACQILEKELIEAQSSEDEHILDNYLDDREEQVGHEP